MLGFIKLLPILIVIGGGAYAGHQVIVSNLESRIAQQEARITQVTAQNSALQAAAEQNEATIRNMEARAKEQVQRMTALTEANSQLQSDKEEYLSIFRRHDLYRLALARPGMVEPRLNNGTQDVFRQLEADSRELDMMDGTASLQTPDENDNND